jgi:hypothetical protein
MPPHGDSRTPLSDLEQAIQDRIVERTGGRVRGLKVEVSDDRVLIQGRTASFHLKQLAIQGILEVVGSHCTRRIEHNIQVDGKPPKSDPEAG